MAGEWAWSGEVLVAARLVCKGRRRADAYSLMAGQARREATTPGPTATHRVGGICQHTSHTSIGIYAWLTALHQRRRQFQDSPCDSSRFLR